jgi:GntR family transcriptional regulator
MSPSDEPDSRPLYTQVRDQLLARISSGEWKPGQLIPTEFAIAAEYGVSQGTARKAISDLAAEQILMRRQGRGTFVVEHTPAQVSFRFFNFFDDNGERIVLGSRRASCTRGKATRAECDALHLPRDASVLRIYRVRTRGHAPIITEDITLPERLFRGLRRQQISNALYDQFQKDFGILVVRTQDRLSVAAADARCARELGIPERTPLLEIDRITFAPDDVRVEWRVSLCHLHGAHYSTQTR